MVEKRESQVPAINEPYEPIESENQPNFEDIEEEEKEKSSSSDGAFSDESVDLDEQSQMKIEMTDDELMELLIGKHRFNDRGKLLHIGIIDYLQTYTTFKKTERLWK